MATQPTSSIPDWITLAWRLKANRYELEPAEGLSLSKIVLAAVAVGDEQGFAGVSMAKVAARLGVATMSLYNHVPSKDDLLLIMTDSALGAPSERVREATTWQQAMATWTSAAMEQFELHPWLIEAPLSGPPSTPNRLLWIEYLLQSMVNSGLTAQEVLDCSILLYAHVRYSVQLKLDNQKGLASRQNELAPSWTAFIDTATYPQFSKLIAASESEALEEPNNDFGLERLIAGIERLQHDRRR